jgi:8-oxo-dGTP pyrophosphatase MutT (NUDIX family)
MKKLTCGVVLIDKEGSILGCHPYGKRKSIGYDFPKGCKEDGEEDLETACRELYEETNITLTDEDKKDLIDLGIHKHNKEKNIHLFLLKVEEFPKLNLLRCNSFFENHGKEYPEVDEWRIIKKDERHLFNNVLQNKFKLIDENNV